MTTICLSTNGPALSFLDRPPDHLFAATLNGVVEFRKQSGDDEWRQTRICLDDKHISALMAPPSLNAIFAGAHNGGLYRSTPDSGNWTLVAPDLASRHIFSLDYGDYGSRKILYAGTEPVSLLRSLDGGATWQELPSIGQVPGHEKWTFPPPPHHAHTKCFLFDPDDADVIYAGVEQGALLKSIDGGLNWRELDSFYRPDHIWYKDIHRLARHPTRPSQIYMATGMGLFISEDLGESWQHLTNVDSAIGYPDQIFILSESGELLMSGAYRDPSSWRKSHKAHGAIMHSSDGGRSWDYADEGLPRKGRANIEAFNMCRFPGGSLLLCGNTDGKIFESRDDAVTWRRICAGLPPISKGGHFRNLRPAAE